MSDRRVVGLRERLLRAGNTDTGIAPENVSDPALFDERVDRAVRWFQQHKGLIVDGLVGLETDAALNDAQYTLGDRPLYFNDMEPLHGDDVEELQNNLSLLGFYYGHLNGTFTQKTAYAVRELQCSLGVECDGVVDLETLTGLARVSKKITTSKAFSLRDHQRLEALHEALRDRVIVLVPSRASSQVEPAGAPSDFAAQQDSISYEVALRSYDLLHNVGAAPVLVDPSPESLPSSIAGTEPEAESDATSATLHAEGGAVAVAAAGDTAAVSTPEADPSDGGTADAVRGAGHGHGVMIAGVEGETSKAPRHVVASVDEVLRERSDALIIRLQCDWNVSPQAQGVATFFWGAPESGQPYSPIGQLASDKILRELVSRTGAQDLGSHARQWSALRSAGTAAAWVDLGYLSNEAEAKKLSRGSYRARLAESVLCGLQRVLVPEPSPAATGTMSLADIQNYYRNEL